MGRAIYYKYFVKIPYTAKDKYYLLGQYYVQGLGL
jgi:hypothetical protein